jgi:catalase
MSLMGDPGIPDWWRFMHRYMGHTLEICNKAGDLVFVQLYLKSKQAARTLTRAEPTEKSPDALRRICSMRSGVANTLDGISAFRSTAEEAKERWERQDQ